MIKYVIKFFHIFELSQNPVENPNSRAPAQVATSSQRPPNSIQFNARPSNQGGQINTQQQIPVQNNRKVIVLASLYIYEDMAYLSILNIIYLN